VIAEEDNPVWKIPGTSLRWLEQGRNIRADMSSFTFLLPGSRHGTLKLSREAGKIAIEMSIEDFRVCPEFLFQGLSSLMLYQPGNGALRVIQVSENQGIRRACLDTVGQLSCLNPVHA